MKVRISKINNQFGDYYRFEWPRHKLIVDHLCNSGSIDDFELVEDLLRCIYLLRVKSKITDIDEKYFYIQTLSDRLFDILRNEYSDDVLKS